LTPAGPLLALLGCLLMNWAASSVMMFFVIRMMKRIIDTLSSRIYFFSVFLLLFLFARFKLEV